MFNVAVRGARVSFAGRRGVNRNLLNAAAHNRQPAVRTHCAFGLPQRRAPFFNVTRRVPFRIMRNGLANWMTTVLLMFQLVLGMQLQVAHANVDPAEGRSSGVDARHCPDHPSQGAPSAHTEPVHKHDCCSSVDCQCHGAQSPAAFHLTLVGVVGFGSLLLPSLDARPPVARTNELFRPPIA